MFKKWYKEFKGLFIFGVIFILAIIVIITMRTYGYAGW